MTEAYPLRWPAGWPKTPPADRERGHQFKTAAAGAAVKSFVTWYRSRRLLVEELERMGVPSVVISSSVDVRTDGSPRAGVNPDRTNLKEPGVALYFMFKNRPVVMAQDAFDNPAANLRSLGLAIEAMRSLERHGGGILMEKAFEGFTALAPPEGSRPRRPWWEVLGYPADPDQRDFLTVTEVEARYRGLARKAHPDQGGSTERMAELSDARDDAVAEFKAAGESDE